MNDFTQSPNDPANNSPQVRTLLLTDLCDSTSLVERLGDTPAAELFRAHDRLVLELQQRWRGRLIDRSDGLLLLFERPVDGLGFALDYARGLRELADRPELKQLKLNLQARAGLHVGEVLTWHNSEAAVQAGAKPLEVEGLAKPLAGRLMTLARPGQILLSATAEPLARRASRELGDRSEHLIWKSHGRWRFKGVPDGQEVFEVGEPGYAPLRAPKQNGGKAWRDIPVWRRPAALAAEMMLVVGIGTGAWFLTRPTPAIAFNERDWVVVGDLRNLTGEPVLDESLEQAFRISLEQSRYVNVLSDLKVRDTLALMKREPNAALDRTVASEIALRDGARAVILPTVAEVGGRVRVSAEVIDPHTQTTVYAESADGVGAGSALGSIDKVTGELREKLGEAIASIQRDSEPLPQVSTNNLDALKAYSLGLRAHFDGKAKQALSFFKRATELDPNFALAHLAAGRVYGGIGDVPGIRREFDLAKARRDHLAPREQLVLDAQLARFGAVDPMLERWQQLIDLYPDNFDAHFILGIEMMLRANRFEDALGHAEAAAVPQNPQRDVALGLQGMLLTGLERTDEALKAYATQFKFGYKGAASDYARAYAVRRDFTSAYRIMQSDKSTGMAVSDLREPLHDMLFALDQGQWREASAAATTGTEQATRAEPLFSAPVWRIQSLSVESLARNKPTADIERALLAELARVREQAASTDAIASNYSEVLVLAIGDVGASLDSRKTVEAALRQLEGTQDIAGFPLMEQMRTVLEAERDRLSGHAETAVEALDKLSRSPMALVSVHAALARAGRDAGNDRIATREWQWLAAHRGRAYMDWAAEGALRPLDVAQTTLAHLELAELLAKSGEKAAAQQELARFQAAWKTALPRYLQQRVDALKPQSA
ncbi:putative peptide modification system cyclase [Lysobacter sp. KIS68-7]|uniref:putative peptide modification system cyclase n=1 Tax=Lysobacter sp. KIS68-7 TaxID=2904252 RepID=UPI001E415FA5|nr:putative peptide modification system cyclase [Lysobacter sp. KIS68-7]UHQ20563.1 putative peptide modification system cyclase [Lysobacter sp. KIS68-7]